jgi:hypothetical protein
MDALWIAVTLLVAGGVGWPVTTGVLKLARTVDKAADRDAAGAGPTTDGPTTDGPTTGGPATDVTAQARILRGGLLIGILERLGVALAVLAGEPVTIAYIVAVKGLGRYAELKETPAAAERFIIGTLTSLLWAAGIALAARRYLL